LPNTTLLRPLCYSAGKREERFLVSNEDPKATIYFAGEDLFVGVSPSGHAQALDTNHERGSAATPM